MTEQFEKVCNGLDCFVNGTVGPLLDDCKRAGCKYLDNGDCEAAIMDDALALIRQQQERIRELEAGQQWISVKDRLPQRKWIDCLVATKIQGDGTRGFNIAWVNDDNGVWKSNDEWICDGREIVTHWMPLPEPPKEEENGDDL